MKDFLDRMKCKIFGHWVYINDYQTMEGGFVPMVKVGSTEGDSLFFHCRGCGHAVTFNNLNK